MRFYVSLWNHHRNSREIVLDIVEPIAAGLQDLGHRVELGLEPPRRGAVNIIVENFHYKRVARQIRPYDFVIIATERIDGAGFNDDRSPHWRKRWANFTEVAGCASAIWAIADYTAQAYGRFAPSAQVTLGWSPRLEQRISCDQVFDVCAYGNLGSPVRKATLAELESRLRVGSTDLASKADRDRMIARSLFSYGFRPAAEMGCASISRIVASLRLGIPVIQERVAEPTELVKALEIVKGPAELLARWDDLNARRDQILERQLAAWRALPASKVMAEAIAAMRPREASIWRTTQQMVGSLFPRRGYT